MGPQKGSYFVGTLEIIRGKLLALADEMGIVLARTAMSPVIYEVLDFACGFCDPEGQLVAQTNGITVFTGTFACTFACKSATMLAEPTSAEPVAMRVMLSVLGQAIDDDQGAGNRQVA